MTDEHKKAIGAGRQKYWDKVHAEQERLASLTECDKCTMIDWFAKQTGTEIDKEHCPIKCRYNKEVETDVDNAGCDEVSK